MSTEAKTMDIRMVDLYGQYKKIQHEIDDAVATVIHSTAFINGPAVKEFSQSLSKHLNIRHVIPCGNGTDALQIALMALGLKQGDEVIVPTFTFVATVEVIALLGLKPKFSDVNPQTFNIETEGLEKLISPQTKCIVPVHLFGQCADMEKIMAFAKANNLFVIEDNAQAIGSDYYFSNGKSQKAGTIGHIGCTSFFPSKNLGAYGDGGALFTNDDTLAEKIRIIANHGSKVKYYHESIGVNSRLDTIQAAVLNIKLKYLDEFIDARIAAADKYDAALKDDSRIKIPLRDKKSKHVFHQYTLCIEKGNRNELKKKMAERNIPAMVYFPVSMHVQKGYSYFGYKQGDFPVSEDLQNKVLSLPMHTELNDEQIDFITLSIKELL